jgi:hypothetical protein
MIGNNIEMNYGALITYRQDGAGQEEDLYDPHLGGDRFDGRSH